MIMKYTIIFIVLAAFQPAFAQSTLPDFLQGTWKMENRDIYEHWDRLNENNLKGFSYKIENGQMVISEYLDISHSEKETIYTATVLGQNQGKGIEFKLAATDNSTFVFENPGHDFPKKIVYQELADTLIFVQVLGGENKGFSFRMQKQVQKTVQSDPTIDNPNYDPVLAQKLGADNYGMKRYMLVILKTGPNQTTDQEFISNCFRGHLDNINRLADEQKLTVAGPLGRNEKNWRGIFILNVTTPEEAEELLLTDPAIKEGLLDFELYNWYGSAALPTYLEFSDKVWKVKP
jgi:uncharacterized protein YciI